MLLAALSAAPALGQGRFRPGGELATARSGHTATLLKDGRVLVVGGRGANVVELSSVELWEPKARRFRLGPPLAIGRSGHTATALPDGRVVVVGGTAHESKDGEERFVALTSVEIFDPRTNRWSHGPSLNQARHWHTATLLADGRLLVAGGMREQRQLLSSVEAWSVGEQQWVELAEMPQPRARHQAALLPDGTVLVAGGRVAHNGATDPSASTLRFEPASSRWSALPELKDPRQNHALVVLSDGRGLVIGGVGKGGMTNLCEFWRPDDAAWALAQHSLSMALSGHSATVLPSGNVLVVGGEPYNAVDTGRGQVFVTGTQSWCLAGDLKTSRKHHAATLLADGKVLVTGGVSAGVAEASAELWEPTQGRCEEPPGLALSPF